VAGVTPPHGGNAGTCEVTELFSAYLDGELLPGELDRVASHLADCLDCIAEFRAMKEVRTAIRTLPKLEIPASLLPESHHGPALSAYLDGELPTTEHAVVQVHLADCSECRSELHELDAARTAIRSLPRLEPPEFIAFHRVEPVPEKRSRRWHVATAAAAAAAIAVVGIGALRAPTPDPSIDIDSLADRHIARASIEAGFTVVPAAGSFGGGR